MNIHEHQAKEILKSYGAPVSKGVVIFSINDIKEKISLLKSNTFVLKAQIHAGGRWKAVGVKLIKNFDELPKNAKIYIQDLEKFIETKISSISTSPEREDTILIQDPFKN